MVLLGDKRVSLWNSLKVNRIHQMKNLMNSVLPNLSGLGTGINDFLPVVTHNLFFRDSALSARYIFRTEFSWKGP